MCAPDPRWHVPRTNDPLSRQCTARWSEIRHQPPVRTEHRPARRHRAPSKLPLHRDVRGEEPPHRDELGRGGHLRRYAAGYRRSVRGAGAVRAAVHKGGTERGALLRVPAPAAVPAHFALHRRRRRDAPVRRLRRCSSATLSGVHVGAPSLWLLRCSASSLRRSRIRSPSRLLLMACSCCRRCQIIGAP